MQKAGVASNNKPCTVILACSLLLMAYVAKAEAPPSPCVESPRSASAVGACYVSEDATSVFFGNSLVELVVDSQTGYFRDIHNKVTGRHHKLEKDGSWPFGLHLGYPNVPDFLRVEIAADAPNPQRMTYSVAPSSGGQTLKLKYDDLVSTGGALTGVKLVVDIALQDDADYFLIGASVENSGKCGVTNLFSGAGALVAAGRRDEETLVLPGWDYGKLYSNPHEFFERRETFGYPIFGSSTALTAGWIDLIGPDGGIGIGYLNRQGLTMLFNVQRAGEGLNVNWQLFNLFHEGDPWGHVGGVFPLQPGQSFTTDPWVLACHAGDWHRMADIYRAEYEKAFQGTFLNETNNNPVAEQIDFVTAFTIHSETAGDTPARKFREVTGYVRELCENLGVRPGNVLLVLLGHGEHYPYYMPDFLPCNTQAGGDAECKKMIAELAQMGMRSVLFYGHPYYNSPKARDYVAKADTGYDHLNCAWPNIGNVACLDSPEWHDLWRKKYIPGFDELGGAGVYWDQGATQYLVCPRADHPHGSDSVKQLAAHTKGILELQQDFHSLYKGRSPIFWTEVGSDLTGRTMDIWTTTPGGYARGGVLRKEIVRYAIPYHLCADMAPASVEDVNNALVNGFIVWAAPTASKEVMRAQCRYTQTRRELRDVQAPGFPHGFRDAVGLTVSDSNLVARSYRDGQGVCIVYYARTSLEGTITVDLAALGFPGKGAKTLAVKLEENEPGYEILIP